MIRKIAPILLILIVGCSEDNNSMDAFKRLEGRWTSEDKSGIFIESWETINDSLMRGSSCMIMKGDTVFSENLALVHKGKDFIYIPTVPGENNGDPISFKLRNKEENKWTFENKEHDFPQQIIYNFIGKDSLMATVQGYENGKFRKLEFPMKKQN